MDPQILPPQSQPSQESTPQVSQTATAHSKKLFLAMLVIIVLLLGEAAVVGVHYYYEHHNKTQAVLDEEEHTYEATVGIDANGFTPGTITIKPQTEIFFENNTTNAEGEAGISQRVVQSKAAASQEAGFNSGLILAKSGYGHVFRKVGTYRFFLEDNLAHTLTVIVKN